MYRMLLILLKFSNVASGVRAIFPRKTDIRAAFVFLFFIETRESVGRTRRVTKNQKNGEKKREGRPCSILRNMCDVCGGPAFFPCSFCKSDFNLDLRQLAPISVVKGCLAFRARRGTVSEVYRWVVFEYAEATWTK